MVKPIPDGYHTITPYITINGALKAIAFYEKAFGAQTLKLSKADDGKVMHAVIRIGDSPIMLSDEFPNSECGMYAPSTLKGTTIMLHCYVEDADAFFNKAVQAGATINMPLSDTFWGDRYGQLKDPFGYMWSVSTHKFDPTPDQIQKGIKDCSF
jgi:uncharacterized glyoxalase superfamily protein PhnB